MDIAVTKMSAKGQVVIPAKMRADILQGDKLIIIQSKDSLILKKAASLAENFEEDLKFARRTEAAWRRYQKGQFKTMDAGRFVELLKKC